MVDNTSMAARLVAGHQLPNRLHLAVSHVFRNASKVLAAGWSLRVLHKGVYGYKDTWQPDTLAYQARDSGFAWETSKPPLCEVLLDNPVYGNFQGVSSTPKGLDPKVLFAFDMTAVHGCS